MQALDDAGVPMSTSRDDAREVLKSLGIAVKNDALGVAIRRRKQQAAGQED